MDTGKRYKCNTSKKNECFKKLDSKPITTHLSGNIPEGTFRCFHGQLVTIISNLSQNEEKNTLRNNLQHRVKIYFCLPHDKKKAQQ